MSSYHQPLTAEFYLSQNLTLYKFSVIAHHINRENHPKRIFKGGNTMGGRTLDQFRSRQQAKSKKNKETDLPKDPKKEDSKRDSE